jgi:ABC-type branched-subunit amino acid transport system ATPase component
VNLAVRNLEAGYGSGLIVRGVSFDVQAGGALAILGRNGMGKSTLVRAMLGYLQNVRGSVRIKGREILGLPTHVIIRMGFGYAPQDAAIFGDLSVNDNLRLGAISVRDFQERRDAVLFDFPALGMRLAQKAGTLSGGEQKMLILARALIANPDIIVLDEISEGLQPSMLGTVRKVIGRLRERRATLILVEQNVDLALTLADRVALLQVGEFLFERSASDPEVRDQVVQAFVL